MNTRINELAGQALAELAVKGWDLQTSPFNLFTDRFAELLVRECAALVWYSREDNINGNISEVIKQRIKTHFGVKP